MSSHFGKYAGIVWEVNDPEQLGRVRVRCAALFGEVASGWASPSVPFTGLDGPMFQVPPIGTRVWLELEAGDLDRPIYSGCFLGPNGEPLVGVPDEEWNTEISFEAVRPTASWTDLILPKATIDALKEIAAQVRVRTKLLGDEESERGHALGGVTALFAGPSGTGKTMAAEVIARDLGFDLYRVDLSAIVSKYIGETEKNLLRVFDEATRVDVVLLFDEADALFGKRSAVKDAHDRYANIEVNYLLQKMEDFDGLAILATDTGGNLDPALARRLAHIVTFARPREPRA